MSDVHTKALQTVPATIPATEQMTPFVSTGLAILQANPNAETLRELIALHRETKADAARDLYAVALAELKRDLPDYIIKRKQVLGKDGKTRLYKHTTLNAVMSQVDEALERHGFTVTWAPACDGRLVTVTCRLHHVGGHVEEAIMSAPPDAGPNRNAVQAIGSTKTYLQRYTVLALLGLSTADADDADQRPTAEANTRPDAMRNLEAMGRLAKKHGKTKVDAEQHVGRPVQEWTAADLETLAAWVTEPASLEDEAAEHDSEMEQQ